MKHLVDLDEDALAVARARLGTNTIRDTVNAALKLVSDQPGHEEIEAALGVLAAVEFIDRDQAWR